MSYPTVHEPGQGPGSCKAETRTFLTRSVNHEKSDPHPRFLQGNHVLGRDLYRNGAGGAGILSGCPGAQRACGRRRRRKCGFVSAGRGRGKGLRACKRPVLRGSARVLRHAAGRCGRHRDGGGGGPAAGGRAPARRTDYYLWRGWRSTFPACIPHLRARSW